MGESMTQQVNTVSQARSGPMPATGRWGWYRDHEGNEYRRASVLIKEVETDRKALDDWFRRQVAEGLAIRDDLVLALKAMGRPDPLVGWTSEQKKKINDIANDAMAAAKQRDGGRAGTAYHDLTERVDRGEDIEAVVRGLPADAGQTLRAYAFLRRENGWVNVEVERTVHCEELEVCGTFDRVDLVPGLAALLGPGDCQYGHATRGEMHFGETLGRDVDHLPELPVIVDVKTEKQPLLNGLHIGPQLAIYSRARRMWRPLGGMVPLLDREGRPKTYPNSGDQIMIPAGEYVPAPCVRQDVAIMVHLIDGTATPVFVNLTSGWRAARRAYEQINDKAQSKLAMGRQGAWFAEVPNVKRPRVAELLVQQAASRDTMAGHSLPGETAAPQQAVRDSATGMVSWQPEPAIGTQVEVGGVGFTKVDSVAGLAQHGALDEVDRSAIGAVWSAVNLDGPASSLAEVYRIYVEVVGRPWGGRVAEAAEARRRQIQCPQRQLHAGDGKCGCGWVAGVLA
jgi:hypothetical protein